LAAAASSSNIIESNENNICQPTNNFNTNAINSNSMVPPSNMNITSGGILPFNPPQPPVPRAFNPFTQAQAMINKDHVNSYNNNNNTGYKHQQSQQSFPYISKQSILPPPPGSILPSGVPPHFQQPNLHQNQYISHQNSNNQPIVNRLPTQYHKPQLNPNYQQYQQNQQQQHYQQNNSSNSNSQSSHSYNSEKKYNTDDSRLTGNKRNIPP
jgi:hypothetical protein